MTEPEWVESLKGDPEEIAQEVVPLIDVGDTTLNSKGRILSVARQHDG